MSLRSFLVTPTSADTPVDAAADRAGDGPWARCEGRAVVLGLVCERTDGAALGAAAALVLLARHRVPTAAVALHRAPAARVRGASAERSPEAPTPAGPAARAWSLPAARRLATALRGRGLPALAAGRLATVRLPDDPDDVLAAAERTAVTASRARAATVVVVAGPRAGALDEVLARCDAVVVVTPPARRAVAGLAADALAALSVPVTSAGAVVRGPARALAAAGLVAPTDLRSALVAALDVLRTPS